jgi:predicted Zn finger-like uncharacterized protein
VIINIQCTSCHTRYRIDEAVLPEGTPTFKCSRCNHVFSLEPRQTVRSESLAEAEPPPDPLREAGVKPSAPVSATSAPDSAISAPAAQPTPATDRQAAADPPSIKPPYTEEAKQPSPDERLEKLMRAALDESDRGANLAFDFSDEPAPSDGPQQENFAAPKVVATAPASIAKKKTFKWQVGDEPDVIDSARRADGFRIGSGALGELDTEALDGSAAEEEFVDETRAPVYNRAVTHSSRLFLTLFILVAVGFAATTMVIHSAPAGALEVISQFPIFGDHFAQPMVPARMVALRNVHATYQSTKDGRPALVIQGEGENVSQTALHTVQIQARLGTPNVTSGREVYCGNNLTADIRQMTSHEIEFFQKQPPPQDFTLNPAASSRFVIVFLDPPAQTRTFELAVTQAQPPDSAGSPPPAS